MFLTALLLYFIPHSDNNYRAKLLNPFLIAITVLTFFAAQIGLSFLPKFTPIVLGYVSNISPEEVISLTNKERVQSGLPTLNTDSKLTEAALSKGAYMLAKNYWAHTAPDGTEPWKFILDSGYKYRFAGENLARDFATPEAVVAAWMASQTHKDNLLSAKYQDIGIAVVKGDLNGVQTTLVVQMLGTKMSSAALLEKSQNSPKVESIGSTQDKVAGIKEESGIFVSPFNINKNLAVMLLSIFMLVISIDMIIINQKQVARSSSKSFAHFFFFGMIMIAIIISKAGNIL